MRARCTATARGVSGRKPTCLFLVGLSLGRSGAVTHVLAFGSGAVTHAKVVASI